MRFLPDNDTVASSCCSGLSTGKAIPREQRLPPLLMRFRARMKKIMNLLCRNYSPRCQKKMASKTVFSCRNSTGVLTNAGESSQQSVSGKGFFGKIFRQSTADKLCQLRSKSDNEFWQWRRVYLARHTCPTTESAW